MTRDQIISKIETDAFFGLGFALDNNPSGVIEEMRAAGVSTSDSPSGAFNVLKSLLIAGEKEKVKNIISSVPYLDSADNYTGGLKDYFLLHTPPAAMPGDSNTRFSFDGLLAAIGAGLTGFVSYNAATQAAATSQPADAATLAAIKAEEEKRKKEEAEKERKRKIILWSCIGGGVLLFLIILWYMNKDKKQNI